MSTTCALQHAVVCWVTALPHGPSSAIFKKSQASKLGDAQGIPFFINNHRFYSWYYIFISLHIMCCSWSVSLFYFWFVYVLFSGLCNKLDPCMVVWERDTLRFFIRHLCSSLICVECLDSIIVASSSCFSCISCSKLLAFVVRKYSLVLLPISCFK